MQQKISEVLEENIAAFREMFGDDSTLIRRHFQPLRSKVPRCCLFCIDGMVDSALINDHIIRPVTLLEAKPADENAMADFLQQQVLQTVEAKQETDIAALVRSMLYGDSVLLIDGSQQALLLGTKNFMKRGITEPGGETVLKGPREGFVEPILHNLALIRRKLRTTDLKFENFTLGESTKTECCICYLDSVVDRSVLAILRDRIKKISFDGILDSNYVAEMVRDHRYSIFRTTGSTERPDVVAAKLLEGRIALFVDGSPVAVTVPYIFLEHFQSSEDYYVEYTFAGINRFLRMAGFFAAVSVLPIYLSLVTFHQAFMPLPLILSIAKARQDVPFPILVESLLLLLAFDILREAGVRTPSNLGQTLSVVGGLVIGQAAVDARLVSVPVLIIVATSGICALIAPKLKAAIVLCRLVLMVLGAAFGFYGYLLGMLGVIILLSEQTSFGVCYLSSLPLATGSNAEDSVFRTPFWSMQKYGRFLAHKRGNGQ